MLVPIVAELDAWIIARDLEARDDGTRRIGPCVIRLLGQMALIEGGCPLTLAATNDVDIYADYEHAVQREFTRLLAKRGLELDPLGHEVWMPTETEYTRLYAGQLASLLVADVDAVLLSKALKAPAKNKALVIEYLARGGSLRFFALAARYGLDLEALL